MEAIVLAGGLGSRLRPIVADVPKPMAQVAGRPFLEILLRLLASKGFSRIVLSLGFKAESISSYFGSRFSGMALEYIVEDVPLGTGGAIRLSLEACNQDHAFVFNGDTYLDLDVESVERLWKTCQSPIVVAREVDDTLRYGRLVVNDGRVIRFSEKGVSGAGLINAGCYVLATDALRDFPSGQPFSIESDYLFYEVERARVEAFVCQARFIDIGVPEDYIRAQTLLANA